MKVLSHFFQQRDWVFVNYHDKMSQKVCDHIIITFRDDLITKIMIISLKCNDIKLNLIMILRIICVNLWWNSSVKQQVFYHIFHIDQFFKIFIIHHVIKNNVDKKLILHIICVDLWWNSSVKQQVFCHIFHINQSFKIFITRHVILNSVNKKLILHIICVDLWWNSSMKQQVFCHIFHIDQFFEIFITHFVIKNSIDEKLQMLQNSKREIIDIIIDDVKMLNQLSLTKLIQLFKSMSVEENKKSFILMNESEKNENVNEKASTMRDYELRMREMLIVISWI